MPSDSALSIREIISQTKPFRSRSHEAVLGVFMVADRLRRHFQQVVEPETLTMQQYNVLRILKGAGPKGTPTLSIPERMVERTPGITRLIDRLEAKGLVDRTRCEEDRRLVWASITPQGLDLLKRLDGPIDKADDEALRMLTVDEQDELVRLLEIILNAY